MLSQITILSLLASAMALPKIEHRAEAESESPAIGLTKYFEKFQEYMKGNNDFNEVPESPLTSAGSQVQSDSQYPTPEMPNYQESFKKCMGGYGFPQIPSQGEAQTGSQTGSSAVPNPSNYQNMANQYQNIDWQKRMDECRKQMQSNFPSMPSQFPNPSQFFPSGNGAASGSG